MLTTTFRQVYHFRFILQGSPSLFYCCPIRITLKFLFREFIFVSPFF